MTFRCIAYFLSLCLFALPLASSCGGGEPETIEDYFNAMTAEALRAGEAQCDCYVELGQPSREACIAQIVVNDPASQQCTLDAYALDEAASLAYLKCYLAAAQDLTDCYSSNIVCTDVIGSVAACLDAHNGAFQACPPVPANVVSALMDCQQGPTQRHSSDNQITVHQITVPGEG